VNTIRQRLTRRLLLGWALLLVTGGSIAYWRTHAALTREFDDTLRAKALALTALTEQRNGRIELELADQFAREYEDDADHLSADDVARLFDRFWRKDPARSGAEHAGLGLALARAFAASLGYTLNAALNGDHCLALTLEGPTKLDRANPSISTPEKPKIK